MLPAQRTAREREAVPQKQPIADCASALGDLVGDVVHMRSALGRADCVREADLCETHNCVTAIMASVRFGYAGMLLLRLLVHHLLAGACHGWQVVSGRRWLTTAWRIPAWCARPAQGLRPRAGATLALSADLLELAVRRRDADLPPVVDAQVLPRAARQLVAQVQLAVLLKRLDRQRLPVEYHLHAQSRHFGLCITRNGSAVKSMRIVAS